MAFRNWGKIPRVLFLKSGSLGGESGAIMYFHKHRMYSSKKGKKCRKAVKFESDRDSLTYGQKVNKACQKEEDEGPKKSSIWSALFGGNKCPREETKTLPICSSQLLKDDPDLSMFEGEKFGTCGDAYVIKIENVGDDTPIELDKEARIINKIEAPEHLKSVLDTPTPYFRSAEQRLLELSDRKLHPLFDKLRLLKKKPEPPPRMRKPEYKFFAGPLKHEDIPVQLKFNKELLEAKHMHSEFKRVEPPLQLVGRLVEIKRNERKYDEKPKVFFRDEKLNRGRSVYDSVFQDPVL